MARKSRESHLSDEDLRLFLQTNEALRHAQSQHEIARMALSYMEREISERYALGPRDSVRLADGRIERGQD